ILTASHVIHPFLCALSWVKVISCCSFFFFQAEDGIRDRNVTGVQTCALPILGVLMLSQHVAREYASDLLSTDAPGIGYLLKDRITEIDGFLDAVHRVADGGTVIDPAVVRSLL